MLSFSTSSCQAVVCFCERAINQEFFRQPVNTISSLVLVAAGVLLIARSRGSWPRRTIGVAMIVAGLGSALYHGTLLQATQAGDVFGLLVIAATVTILELGYRFRWRTRTHIIQWAMVVVFGMLSVLLPAGIRQPILAAVFAVGICASMVRVWSNGIHARRVLGSAAAVLLGGLLVWSADESSLGCAIHGHGLWHVAGAVAAWLYASTWPPFAKGAGGR